LWVVLAFRSNQQESEIRYSPKISGIDGRPVSFLGVAVTDLQSEWRVLLCFFIPRKTYTEAGPPEITWRCFGSCYTAAVTLVALIAQVIEVYQLMRIKTDKLTT
jgi:hypothetical protein